jgi:hypothetical protein
MKTIYDEPVHVFTTFFHKTAFLNASTNDGISYLVIQEPTRSCRFLLTNATEPSITKFDALQRLLWVCLRHDICWCTGQMITSDELS